MAKTSVLKSPKTLPPPAPQRLLAWYETSARPLPWRENQGRAPSPYHTWISEIMLQQTTVATVIPYYLRFIQRWPTVAALAAASQDEVLKEWAGLGYYSRARNLHACAKHVQTDHGGVFPDDIASLKKLPGIGDYTANAVRAIAFDKPANVVDGNVERVMVRIIGFDRALNEPANKRYIRDIAGKVAPDSECGHYAQALMDLGATICTPQNPKCTICPWQKNCVAYATGRTKDLPVIIRKKDIPTRYAAAFVITDKRGRVYMRQRPAKGLLGGLWEVPSTEWRPQEPWHDQEISQLPYFKALQSTLVGKDVVHVFSHFKLIVRLYASRTPEAARETDPNGEWHPVDTLPAMATLTEKMLKAAKILG